MRIMGVEYHRPMRIASAGAALVVIFLSPLAARADKADELLAQGKFDEAVAAADADLKAGREARPLNRADLIALLSNAGWVRSRTQRDPQGMVALYRDRKSVV